MADLHTAGEVNASIARAIDKFRRQSGKYGPEFQAMVTGIIKGSSSFGDGEEDFTVQDFVPAVSPTIIDASTFTAPTYTNLVADIPFVSLAPPNVPATASTVSPTLASTLNNLVNGINSGAAALVQGTTAYYNALTQVRNIQGAAAAGVPVSTFAPGTGAGLMEEGFLGVPAWLWLGGALVAVMLTENSPSSGRRR